MKLCKILALGIGLLAAGSLHAATVTFTGAVDEFWSNPDNWDTVPGINDKARVRSEGPCVLDYDAGIIDQYVGESSTVGHLILVDGAQLAVKTWNIIGYAGGEADNRHTIEVLGGVLNGGHPDYPNNGRINVGRQGYAHLIIDHGGEVNLLHQALEIGNNTNGDGLVELRGGTLNLTDNGDAPLSIATGTDAVGLMDFSGGVMKQRFSEGRLTRINDYIANGMITAYSGVGTVVVESIDENSDDTLDTLLVKGRHPLTPGPEDGAKAVPGSVALSWTLPDPCVPGQSVPVDVYFTDDLQALKSFIDPDAIRIAGHQSITSITVQAKPKTRYYWAVDTYQGTENDPVWGPIFEFYADNIAPVVATDLDVTTWLTHGTVDVAIGGTVTDADPTTTTWTVVSEPNEGTAVIANPSQVATTATLTALGTYVLQLEADDGEYTGANTLTIHVFANSCLAAQSLPGYTPIPGDINLDCVVDQTDIDLLLEQWLKCNGLDCPTLDPVDPNLN
jgi:hypothetical protein